MCCGTQKQLQLLIMVMSLSYLFGIAAHASPNYLNTTFEDYKKQQAVHDEQLMQQHKPVSQVRVAQTQSTKRKININQVNEHAIMQALHGVGMVKAKAIVSHRQRHGKFRQVEDLLQVKGIGKATLAKNKHLIYCD